MLSLKAEYYSWRFKKRIKPKLMP